MVVCSESMDVLESIFQKESQWKNLLLSEIQRISAHSVELQEALNVMSTQFEQMKEAFTYNLKILKERDAAIISLKSETEAFKNALHEKDILLTETNATVDRYQSQVELLLFTEKQLRLELEEHRRDSTNRELELQQQHTDNLKTLRKTELEEKAKLQATITRLQTELEAEQLRSAAELEAAVDRVCNEAEKAATDAGQKQLGLELQIQTLKEVNKRIMQAKEDAMKQLDMKQAEINDLRLHLTRGQNEIQSLSMEIRELASLYAVNKEHLTSLEVMHNREKTEWNTEKLDLQKQIDNLSSDLTLCRTDLNSLLLERDEARATAEAEKQELLETLTRARRETQLAMESLKEANTTRQIVDRNARAARNEVERLRKDLEQALKTAVAKEPSPVSCKHEQLIEQLTRLQSHCEQLEEENCRLRKSINVMTEEASQIPQQKPEQDGADPNIQNFKLVQEKLRLAVNLIRQLSQEKQSLIELSNRLHAQVRQLQNKSCAPEKEKIAETMNPLQKPLQNFQGVNDAIPSIVISDFDDAVSSVMGKDSVSALFHLLDESASQFSDPRTAHDCTLPPKLAIHGDQKPIRSRCLKPVNVPKLK